MSLSSEPNFWIGRDDIASGTCRNSAEQAVANLYALVADTLPERWSGAEYWVQIYEKGRGLAFHFDKDEYLLKEEGRMVMPAVSSILFLSGSQEGPTQAPTVITDQRFDQDAGCTVPENPTCSTLAFPLENSYCIFDGQLGHGVLDCGHTQRRDTLLVNWWVEKPQGIHRAEHVATQGFPVQATHNEGPGTLSAGQESIVPLEVDVSLDDLDDELRLLMVSLSCYHETVWLWNVAPFDPGAWIFPFGRLMICFRNMVLF